MIETFDLAGYCRISVDEELDRDNTSIENQKAIIEGFVRQKFPGSILTFYEDRDKSGYTFDQRPGYQEMRRELVAHKKDILIVKDFSRFSRRNSRGLVELEDLRDAGVRIISIGDGIDFPNDDDWLKIQFQFLINEMPVTDTSKKVKSVIKRRQQDGQWLCAAPYGYILNKHKEFEIVPTEAEIVREIFRLYIDGWGYKKIANFLTDLNVPTPRMSGRQRGRSASVSPSGPGPSSPSRASSTTTSTLGRCGRGNTPAKRSTARTGSGTSWTTLSLSITTRPLLTTGPLPLPRHCGRPAPPPITGDKRSMITPTPAFWNAATVAPPCSP